MCVITTNRADYGIYMPVLRQLQQHPETQLQLIVTGAHLSPEFGRTISLIEADGFKIDERVEMLLSSDTAEGTVKSMGLAMIGLAQSYARLQPDLIVALGDRFEMHAAVAAAVSFRLPVAHIAGGELTEGALDDLFRHSITKLSHIHFVSIRDYAARLMRMGEEPWRIHVSGSPSLDHLRFIEHLSRAELEKQLRLEISSPPLLVTLHPETQSKVAVEKQVGELLSALEQFAMPMIFTYPNGDMGSRVIINSVQAWVSQHPEARFVTSLGTQRYYSLLNLAAAMVGNSSSGIVEAASYRLPVVNLGERQLGRPHPINVIDAPFSAEKIADAIKLSISAEFKERLRELVNPFGDGHAGERIAGVLNEIELGQRLLVKRFYDHP